MVDETTTKFLVIFLVPLVPTLIVYLAIRHRTISTISLWDNTAKVGGPGAFYLILVFVAFKLWADIGGTGYEIRVTLSRDLKPLAELRTLPQFDLRYDKERPFLARVAKHPGAGNLLLKFDLPKRIIGREAIVRILADTRIAPDSYRITLTGDYSEISWDGRIVADETARPAVIANAPRPMMPGAGGGSAQSRSEASPSEAFAFLAGSEFAALSANDKVKAIRDRASLGGLDDQILLLEKGVELDPKDELVRLWLAERYLEKGQLEKAAENAKAASTLPNRVFPGWDQLLLLEIAAKGNDAAMTEASARNLEGELRQQQEQGYGYYFWKDNASRLQTQVHTLSEEKESGSGVKGALDGLTNFLASFTAAARG